MNAWHSMIGALPFEWAQYGFLQDALLALLLLAPVFALLGCLVVSNQMSFFSEAVGHASLTGIAIGSLAGLGDPVWSMAAFAVLLAVAVSAFRRYSAVPMDTICGLVMSFAVALGVVLLSRGGGFARYSRYLIGDILTVTPAEIVRMAVVAGLVLAAGAVGFNSVFLVCLNRPLALSRGRRVWAVETCFACVVALVVTVSIPWIGLLVINSLLILPAAAARNVARNVPQYLWIAVGVALLSGVGGLIASYYWATATGATVVLLAMGFFVLSLVPRRLGTLRPGRSP